MSHHHKTKDAAVKDCVDSIFTQTRMDEKFRADIEKDVAKVYDEGAKTKQQVCKSEPLTEGEILTIREALQTFAISATSGKK